MTTIHFTLLLPALAASAFVEASKASCEVRLSNYLPIPAVVELTGNEIVAVPPNQTITLKLENKRICTTLRVAAVDADGDLFFGSLDVSLGQHTELWWGTENASGRPTVQLPKGKSLPPTPGSCEILRATGIAIEQFADDGKWPPKARANGDATLRLNHLKSRVIMGTTTPCTFTNSMGIELVHITPGRFLMGSRNDEQGANKTESPYVVLITKPFCIGRTEVTQDQWQKVMGSNPSKHRGPKLPVDSITWREAEEFCNRLAAIEKRKYRLPTEAEWEYACRAGSKTTYYFGDDVGLLGRFAWYNGNSKRTPHEVASKIPNCWGLFDMHGNAREFCSDWWSWRYPNGQRSDPQGPSEGNQKVCRGGFWAYYPEACRSAARDAKPVMFTYPDVGFRVVCEWPAPEILIQRE